MLVIRRKSGEVLLIGRDVQIEVLEVTGSQVKLGVTAPKDVLIMRKEVHITRQQNAAASAEISSLELARLAEQFCK
jgi:carbon storage regulator